MSNPHPQSRKLLRAAYDGKRDTVLQLIKDGVPLDCTHHSGLQALHFAAKSGNVEIAEDLIERGADVNAVSLKGSTALHIASLLGKCDVVKLLLKNGANVNMMSAYNEESFTALYMASQIGHQEIVTLLLAYGADPSIKTKNGSTAETVATQQGHHVIAQILSEYEAKCAQKSSPSMEGLDKDPKDINIQVKEKFKYFPLRATEVIDRDGLTSASEDETDTETIKQDTEGSELDDVCQSNGRPTEEALKKKPRRSHRLPLENHLSRLKVTKSAKESSLANGSEENGEYRQDEGDKRHDSARDIILNKIRANLSPVYDDAIPSPFNSPRKVAGKNGESTE